jgi:molecular chaperone DnaK
MLEGIPPAPRGVPQVEVTFDIDANGILNVKAKDKATNKEQSIRIEASSGLSKDEIEKMKKDAELHAEDDKKKQEMIETKNLADTMVYTSEKMLKDVEEKKITGITDEENTKVTEAIKVLKEVKDKDDVEAIKKASEELSKVAQVVGMKMYQQEQDVKKAGETKPEEKKEGDNDKGPIEGEVVK